MKRTTSVPSLAPGREWPGGITYVQYTLGQLLIRAYDVRSDQVVGPTWLETDRYDVVAKTARPSSPEEIQTMLQRLLIERFRIQYHRETRTAAVYALVVDKGGPHLKPADPGDAADPVRTRISTSGHIEAKTTERLARMLSVLMDHPVRDETGLDGIYDIKIDVSREDLPGLVRMMPRPQRAVASAEKSSASDPPARPLVGALKEIGLALQSRKEPTEFLIIDSADRTPVQN